MVTSFVAANVGFAMVIGGLAGVFAWGLQKDPQLWQKLPRAALPGILLGIPCLLGAAWHGTNLLQGEFEQLRIYVWLVVPVIAVLCWFYLDFLFARALGGIFLLSVPYLLHLAFALDISVRPLYSAACYLFGIAGMLLVAIPWRFRDILYKTTNRFVWRRCISVFLGVCAIYFLFAGFFA